MRNLKLILLAVLLMLTCSVCAQAEQAELTAPGYVYVQCGAQYRWYPLPTAEQEEYEITVRQTDADGAEQSNTLHFLHDGVFMSSSTCQNQDCVGEGVVTLDNKQTRILGSWIICLPHQVSVELFTAEELAALMAPQE